MVGDLTQHPQIIVRSPFMRESSDISEIRTAVRQFALNMAKITG
jgi:hypothetical protein